MSRPCTFICVNIARMSISDVMLKLKGKNTLMIFDRHPEYRCKYGMYFRAEGLRCRNHRAAERKNHQEVYRRTGRMQQNRKYKKPL